MIKAVTRMLGLLMVVMLVSQTSYAQDKNVTFQLDLTTVIDSCAFDVEGDIASVNGSFNGWTAEVDTLMDGDGDGIYTKTIAFNENDTLAYKFWLSPAALLWEDNLPTPSTNREYIVGADTDQTIEVATYNKTVSDQCGAMAFPVEIAFQVNLGPQILAGEFDPEAQEVLIAGPFSGWGGTTDTLESQAGFNDSLYANFVTISDFSVGDTIPFKYITKDVEGTIGWENLAPETPNTGGNRFYIITGNEVDDDGDTIPEAILDPVFYADLAYSDLVLFSQETTITLEVDVRPAYYHLADSGFVPSDTQTGDSVFTFAGVFANGPYIAGDWVSWGPDGLGQRTDLQLLDDGTGGDAVAGDSIFTLQVVKAVNGLREGIIKYGLDGWDNESGFGADRNVLVADEAATTVHTIFGLVRRADGKLTDDVGPSAGGGDFTLAWDPYILVDNGTDPPSAVVVRSGGEADGTNTSVDPIDGEVPSSITLSANYPNPFNPSTTFEYSIASAQHVKVRVLNLIGQTVATLVDEVQPASNYQVTFDAGSLSSGVYVYQIETS
ncbi:MAG: T9SS type A sorting domain-containing protein, partial [Rhodothermales bacterium]|nr:T9SS type A sorting domain-containing protein [Rhodothermales bacterium]